MHIICDLPNLRGNLSYNATLTFTAKISKGRKYLYYQAGKESMYISPQNKPDKAKQENVLRVLEHARERTEHYLEAADELLPMLPESLRKKHMARQANLLLNRATRLRGGRLP